MSKKEIDDIAKRAEEIKQIKAMVKNIEKQIKEGRKSIRGFSKRNKYTKFHANDFDEVYKQYGQDAYLDYVPEKYRKIRIDNAIKEGCYMDIIDMHGEDVFNNKMLKIMKKDIQNEADTKLQKIIGYLRYVFPLRTKRVVNEYVAPISMALLMAPATLIVTARASTVKAENEEHHVEIEEYLDDVKQYGESVRKYNLTPLQTMMKVTDDMWSRIDGYGDPEIDLADYAGMDVSKSMGVGVCRNMADDCARRLNAIDHKYNARVIPVTYIDGDYQKADVDIRRAGKRKKEDEIVEETEEKLYDNNKEEAKKDDRAELEEAIQKHMDQFIDTQIKNNIGNHAVVLVDVPEDNITLVFDPTNAGVGVYHNGKITMFNSMVGAHPLEMRTTSYGAFMYGLGTALVKQPTSFLASIGIYDKEKMEILDSKYGLKAQNDALESVRNLNQLTYKASLKVDDSRKMQIDDSIGKSEHSADSNELNEEDIEK